MKKTTLALHCEYSAEELNERRDELSRMVLQHLEIKDRAASVAKQFKEELEEVDSRRDVLARQIRDKGEPRAVECAVDMNRPVPGIKRISRLDTGEFVKDEPMTDEDRQQNLFAEVQEIDRMFMVTDPRPKDDIPPAAPADPPIAPPETNSDDTRGIA